MDQLFGHISPPVGSAVVAPLFHCGKEVLPEKPDDPENGILLSPTLHKVTLWILRSRCYLIAPPVFYEEFRAFNPPCPSATRASITDNESEDLEVWAEQLKHEKEVRPLACADLADAQLCLLHLSALLSLFELFMKPQPAMESLLNDFRKSIPKGRNPDSDGRRENKRRKLSRKKKTGSNRAEAGTSTKSDEADEDFVEGAASELNDQQQPDHPKTQSRWYEMACPTSPIPSTPPSNDNSPSSREGRACHVVTNEFPDTFTPNQSDVDNEIDSDSNPDSNILCDEESDRDEDEERWKDRLRNDTLALSFIKHAFCSQTNLRLRAWPKLPPSGKHLK